MSAFPHGPEWDSLNGPQRRAVRKAITACRASDKMATIKAADGGEGYAYPRGHNEGIHWGFNGADGLNVARGTTCK